MNIQWFPGHMAKTRRLLTENIKMVDAIVEIRDARIPESSKNPEIDKLVGSKPRIMVLNKFDLADAKKSELWKRYYESKGIKVIFTNSTTGQGINLVKKEVRTILNDKIERLKSKGRKNVPVKTMVVGIPNVGKSAFINRIAGKASAKTGNKPGVTRDKQWVRINPEIQLLDTPGILWPKFDDQRTGLHLAFTGAIKDEIMDVAELAVKLMKELYELYPEELIRRYNLKVEDEEVDGLELLEQAGRNRGCKASGGSIDYNRISNLILDDFRAAKIGKMTIEEPAEA